jgi:spore coat polysaccharide biosynthesis predicted glycosyltransferase SpsG
MNQDIVVISSEKKTLITILRDEIGVYTNRVEYYVDSGTYHYTIDLVVGSDNDGFNHLSTNYMSFPVLKTLAEINDLLRSGFEI